MKSLENMKISSISEVKLVRKHLKTQMRFSEIQIQQEFTTIYSGFKSWATYFVVEKSLMFGLSYLMKKIVKRRT